ncbi:NAD(P)-dependent oxidoreductase [Chloroflexus sp.]|uniref:NAD-dependent epimerase/dehydratase family protein n=1 Tax=Chloroflexus sp. TaxID=1904827 RepID=UPI00298EDFC6|nr:NAD(P)-dependent oxidoreductase [Chloroflexus sp.]MDW8403151.1 NAD(P)-dependent oxidoreductase [Chloroflexus sp.]
MTAAPIPHALITGGAGYIGSLLTGVLLNQGWAVTVVDDLLFGGASLLGYWHHPHFRFAKGDVCDPATLRASADGIAVGGLPPTRFDAVIHLAAIVGFPACQMVGPQVAWRYNFEGTKRVFAAADAARVERFVFASTYSNYGLSPDGKPVTEESPLNPQSLYAETKIAAEQFLRDQTTGATTMPILFRFATLFGVSPRTRFDLIVNQFVLEAITRRKLIIYQRGYARSFVHVRDVCDAILLGLTAAPDIVNREIFNVGSDEGNYTKDEIVALVQRYVEGTVVEYKDLTFGGDMRDIRVSFAKIRQRLGFRPRISVEQGIREVADVLLNGVIKDALNSQYRNAQFIVQ